MSEKFTLTGGARIGKSNVTYPLADLYADKQMLKLNASLFGNFVFQAKDIMSVEPYSSFSLFSKGIKINHRVENYKSEVIFWTMKNPNIVIEEIKKTGFFDNLNNASSPDNVEIINIQNEGASPIQKKASILFIAVYILLCVAVFLLPFLQKMPEKDTFAKHIYVPIGFVFFTSILAIVSEKFRKIILKEGRTFDDIKKSAYFIALIMGMMFFVFIIKSLNIFE